ncbi:antiviral reverse transcriptase Drt3b [Flavobacterium sp.]|uniref:antiviral reverse transcriptase Drt3b n=1 Tax=Flavobacterium sp. TaxID=239 RepID=UPI002C162551|nr:antiviral reverse transcriptase Drt3b [Flavobacterium sp.]HSD08177.1 antiviral reverse transcriptase Drt3b [Flavobacterium sp.]
MKKTKKKIDYKKERVVLSDILPYEVPPMFSNRHFYHFLVENKINIKNNELQFKKDSSKTLERLIRLVFGINWQTPLCLTDDYDFFKLKDTVTIPFKFRITHKDKDFRELTLIHPINQLKILTFYDEYKYLILYYSNVSRFSLRKPYKVASLKYFKDSTNKKNKSQDSDFEIIETVGKEYDSLKTFFSYKDYSNIYKFYESYDFHRAEKRFDHLLKFDISRCFDSIYSHTLPWALSNKKIVKDNLGTNANSFGGLFDVIMQKMNYNETNGIVIGPEFSRIFAELILQRIDKNVEEELFLKKFIFKKDYEIYRYVDDFFVFFNDEKIKNEVQSLYKLKLKEYNLFFNESKTEIYCKPIITKISIAKEKIRILIENSTIFNVTNNEIESGVRYHSAKDIITNYKLILSETSTSYKDLQNYFLAVIFNKLKKKTEKNQKDFSHFYNKLLQEKLIKDRIPFLNSNYEINKLEEHLLTLKGEIHEDVTELVSAKRNLYKNITEIIELMFFVYSVLPRVTYSIKVCHILFIIIDFIKNQEKTKLKFQIKTGISEYDDLLSYDFDKKHVIFKMIFDGILGVLKKDKASEYVEIETLYLLPIINQLGKHYFLEEDVLNKHFDVNDSKSDLTYFTIISILNHIERDRKYNNLREMLRNIVEKKLDNFEQKKTEDVLLVIDLLSCPYVDETDEKVKIFRLKILNKIKFFNSNETPVEQEQVLNNIIQFRDSWFTKWIDKDFGKELNTKRGHMVY